MTLGPKLGRKAGRAASGESRPQAGNGWSDAKKEVKAKRRLAGRLRIRAVAGDVSRCLSDGPGHSFLGASVAEISKTKGGRRYASVTVGRSGIYSPAVAVARSIANSINPESDVNRSVSRSSVSGDASAAGIRIRGFVCDQTEYAVKVWVYGRRVWLKKKWVTDLGDGSLRVLSIAFVKSAPLRSARAAYKRLVAKRAQKSGGGLP